MVSAAQAAANWAKALGASTEKIKAGVAAVQESPTAAAARAIDRQVAGVQAAAASGKTQRSLMAVTLNDWQQSMLQKGVGRVASGATQAQPKMQDFLTKFLPVVAQAKAALPPRGDLEQNINRMNSMVRSLSQFSYQK